MALADTLAEYGLTEEEVDLALREEMAGHKTAALSQDQIDFIDKHGGVGEPSIPRDLAITAISNKAALYSTSMTAQQAADRLGVSVSRVHHRLSDHALYGYKVGGKLRLPSWQFDDAGAPLPHLRAVIEALPGDLHPLGVEGFMTTPNSDLEIGDVQVSPARWLADGGDYRPVVALAEDIGIW